MEAIVVITTVQPALMWWVAGIGFFLSLAVTAMLSPNRQWFELVVMFSIFFVIISALVFWIVQGVAGITVIHIETIGSVEYGFD